MVGKSHPSIYFFMEKNLMRHLSYYDRASPNHSENVKYRLVPNKPHINTIVLPHCQIFK
jgi:hypothetical protein